MPLLPIRSLMNIHTPLDTDSTLATFPTLAQSAPHESRSARYALVSTADAIRAMESHGLRIYAVDVARSRVAGAHAKHVVRMRMPGIGTADEAPEVMLINSHNGDSAFMLCGGVLRFVCCNGLVVGDCVAAIRLRHVGNVLESIHTGVDSILSRFRDVADRIDAYKSRTLTLDESEYFEVEAAKIRFPGVDVATLNPSALSTPRRSEDVGRDLWRTFNRVQENATRGGIRVNSRMTRARTMRQLTGIDSRLDVNRRLWNLADSMLSTSPADIAARAANATTLRIAA